METTFIMLDFPWKSTTEFPDWKICTNSKILDFQKAEPFPFMDSRWIHSGRSEIKIWINGADYEAQDTDTRKR